MGDDPVCAYDAKSPRCRTCVVTPAGAICAVGETPLIHFQPMAYTRCRLCGFSAEAAGPLGPDGICGRCAERHDRTMQHPDDWQVISRHSVEAMPAGYYLIEGSDEHLLLYNPQLDAVVRTHTMMAVRIRVYQEITYRVEAHLIRHDGMQVIYQRVIIPSR